MELPKNIRAALLKLTDSERFQLGLRFFREHAVLGVKSESGRTKVLVANERGRFETVRVRVQNGELQVRCTCAVNRPGLCAHSVSAIIDLCLRDSRWERVLLGAVGESVAAGEDAEGHGGPPPPASTPHVEESLVRAAGRGGAIGRVRAGSEDSFIEQWLGLGKTLGRVRVVFSPPARGRLRWEPADFVVEILPRGKQCYVGKNNVLALAQGRPAAGGVEIEAFPFQARRIIRFVAARATIVGQGFRVSGMDLADFFQCLVDYPDVWIVEKDKRLPLHIQATPLYPAVVEEGIVTNGEGERVACRWGFRVEGRGMLPAGKIHVVVGRGNHWAGTAGLYFPVTGALEADVVEACAEGRRLELSPAAAERLEPAARRGFVPVSWGFADAPPILKLRSPRLRPVLELEADGARVTARLRFAYGKLEVPGFPLRPAFLHGAHIVRRRPEAEAEAIERLEKFGFRATPPGFLTGDTYALTNPEQVWRLLTKREHAFPDWEFRESAEFAALAERSGRVGLDPLQVARADSDRYQMTVRFVLPGGVRVFPGEVLSKAAEREVFVLSAAGGPAVYRLDDAARRLVRFLLDRGSQPDATGTLALERYALPALGGVLGLDSLPQVSRIRALRRLARPLDPEEVPRFHAVVDRLRGYQRVGLAWINRLRLTGYHGILADEMGLGKTIQALGALAWRKFVDGVRRPSLVVCPTSLLDNWFREAARFVPELRTVVIRGPEREELIRELAGVDLGITSYAMLRRDTAAYQKLAFDYVILDEAQHIKNPQTANARTCKALRCRYRLILTGTPVENNLSELWSLFDFLLPGMLGPERLYRRAQESRERTAFMARAVRPFILRRTKREVAPELPPKLEQTLYCELGPEQRALYDRYFSAGRRWLARAKQEGWRGNRFHFLAMLTRIRQVCVHPRLLPDDAAAGDVASAKTELLKEIVLEALDSGRRMLVFSQFTTFLRLFREWLKDQGVAYEYLDGSVTDRQARVDRFNRDAGIPVFLVSLRAGGQGLNLTGADTVVHYDLWWNPMVHDQATDRSHRIGQTRTVTVIRLVARNTVEEKIVALHERKRDMVDELVGGVPAGLGELSLEDYEFLLSPQPESPEAPHA